jgi:hypothetical protein
VATVSRISPTGTRGDPGDLLPLLGQRLEVVAEDLEGEAGGECPSREIDHTVIGCCVILLER